MAKMIVCKLCRAHMASNAKACPSCGAKNKKPLYKRLWFIILCVMVLALLIGTTSTSNNKTDSKTKTSQASTPIPVPEQVIEVSAAELIKAYQDNEVRADGIYKNKRLRVSGIVSDISVVLGKTSVTMGTGEMFEWGIVCYPQTNQQDRVAGLNKGDTVTIIGTCDGKSLLSVTMKNCVLE